MVAEDFAPFNIDVTTFASVQALLNYNNVAGMNKRIGHVVMSTQTTKDGSMIHGTSCGCGGIAYVGVFGWYTTGSGSTMRTYNPAFVYNGGVSGGGEAARYGTIANTTRLELIF